MRQRQRENKLPVTWMELTACRTLAQLSAMPTILSALSMRSLRAKAGGSVALTPCDLPKLLSSSPKLMPVTVSDQLAKLLLLHFDVLASPGLNLHPWGRVHGAGPSMACVDIIFAALRTPHESQPLNEPRRELLRGLSVFLHLGLGQGLVAQPPLPFPPLWE